MDILWHCLVEDSECYDDALHWFLNQVRSKDQHAMGMETYKHLFLEKVCRVNCNLITLVKVFLSITPLFNVFKTVSMKNMSSVVWEGLTCHAVVFLCLEGRGKWIGMNSFHISIYLGVSLQIAYVLYLKLGSTSFQFEKKRPPETILSFMIYSLPD